MTRRVEVLTEYERRTVAIPADTARELVRVAGGRLSVGTAAEPGRYELAASQHVGTIVLPDLEVLIRPKVPMENLFLLLGVGVPSEAWRHEMFGFGRAPDLLPAFAAFFLRTLERAVARGLLRAYRPEEDRLAALRGRIDFPAQLRRPAMASPIACRFDEHTADIAENRVLKAAVRRFLRVAGVTPETRQHLLRALSRFAEVADTAVDPDMVDRLVFTRLNRHYEPALRLARLALRATSLTDTAGDVRASAFLLDMNELFERFVTDRLRRALRGRLRVLSQTRHYLGVGRAVPMRPDLEFVAGDRTVYVADTKYKLTDTGLGRNADYYQLLAYTTALHLPEGMLIYCHADGEAPPLGRGPPRRHPTGDPGRRPVRAVDRRRDIRGRCGGRNRRAGGAIRRGLTNEPVLERCVDEIREEYQIRLWGSGQPNTESALCQRQEERGTPVRVMGPSHSVHAYSSFCRACVASS